MFELIEDGKNDENFDQTFEAYGKKFTVYWKYKCRFCAVDKDGLLYVYSTEPSRDDYNWVIDIRDGFFCKVKLLYMTVDSDWKDSLRKL